jgi:hypothetical protein
MHGMGAADIGRAGFRQAEEPDLALAHQGRDPKLLLPSNLCYRPLESEISGGLDE